jgi:lysophospholipase L1-like esterase
MADTLKRHNIKPVFQKLFYQVKNQEYNYIVDTINNKLENYCQQENIEFLDITDGLNEGHHLKIDVCRDGNVHLNEKGYEVWANHLNNFLEKHK